MVGKGGREGDRCRNWIINTSPATPSPTTRERERERESESARERGREISLCQVWNLIILREALEQEGGHKLAGKGLNLPPPPPQTHTHRTEAGGNSVYVRIGRIATVY